MRLVNFRTAERWLGIVDIYLHFDCWRCINYRWNAKGMLWLLIIEGICLISARTSSNTLMIHDLTHRHVNKFNFSNCRNKLLPSVNDSSKPSRPNQIELFFSFMLPHYNFYRNFHSFFFLHNHAQTCDNDNAQTVKVKRKLFVLVPESWIYYLLNGFLWNSIKYLWLRVSDAQQLATTKQWKKL